MSKRSIAALLAGFGTGYMQGEKQKQDQARQDKKDKADEEDRKLRNEDIMLRREEVATQKKRETEALEGFDVASKMKVGELRNEQGAIDNSTQAWQQRIATTPDAEGNLPTAEVAASTAPIYAQEAARKGSEKWLSNPNGILGEVKPTSRGDIKRSQASAMAKLGINGLPQSMALNEKADELDIKDLQTKILSATSIDDLNEHYKIFPDGYDLKGETNAETGRLSYWYENEAGKKQLPDKAMPQDFADFEELKRYASAFVSGNPEFIMQQYENSRKTKREDKKDARDDKVSDAQLAKYEQDIKKGKMELESLPESIQLELKAKKANIAQSYAATESSRESTAKSREERKNGGKPLTLSEKTKSAEIQAARVRIGNLKPAEQAFLQSGDIGEAATITPQQKELQETYKTAMNPDPKLVAQYGSDPALDKFARKKIDKPAPKNRPPLSSFNK